MSLKIFERRRFLAEQKELGKRITIGFSGIADLRSFIALEYINGMMQACEDYDLNFVNMGGAVKYSFLNDINFIQNYTKTFRFMKKPFIDGLITWTSSFYDFMKEDKTKEMFMSLLPIPMVDIGHMNIPEITQLKINTSTAIEKMMEHLIKVHNYSKFAFFGADVSQPHWNRLFSYQKELKKYGIKEIDKSVFMARSMSSSHIAEKVEELIKEHDLHNKKSFDAIVTTTDIIAAQIIEQLSQHGISVPKDIAVTGFNNWYEGITARSPLTSIDLSYYQRGYAAVEILIDRIADPSIKPETILFDTSLVIRQSCGCLAAPVNTSDAHDNESTPASFTSESELRKLLKEKILRSIQNITIESINELVDCIFEDIYTESEKSRIMLWFQDFLQNRRMQNSFDPELTQTQISKLREFLLPIIKTESIDNVIRMESIFHQMRSLVSVFQKYDTLADRENPYKLNAISEQAVNLNNCKSFDEVFEVLKQQLSSYDIPGAVIALCDEMTLNFPVPKIRFVFPQDNNNKEDFFNQEIVEPNFFPKEVFSSDKRFSVMLKILNHGDNYFGYAFFFTKDVNISHFDTIKMLLSTSLYSIYKNNKSGNSGYNGTLNQEQVSGLLKPEVAQNSNKRNRISSEAISKYLTEHSNEKTDVDKMAECFMVSKSFLSKKTKELTGFSIQTLHEKIKIEQAKNMLLLDSIELSQISQMLGFSNQNYFSNVFKKNTGLSPKNWLKKKN